jgi:hypothetical protein
MQTTIRLLDAAAHNWAIWMAEMAWQSALLVAVLLVLDRLYRRASARFLHAVWILILIRLVIPQ